MCERKEYYVRVKVGGEIKNISQYMEKTFGAMGYDFLDCEHSIYFKNFHCIELDGSEITPSNIDEIIEQNKIVERDMTWEYLIIRNLRYDENWCCTKINYYMNDINIQNSGVVINVFADKNRSLVFIFDDHNDSAKFIDTFLKNSMAIKERRQCINIFGDNPIIHDWNDTFILVATHNGKILKNLIEKAKNIHVDNNLKLNKYLQHAINDNVHSLKFTLPFSNENGKIITKKTLFDVLTNCTSLTKLNINTLLGGDWKDFSEKVLTNTNIINLSIGMYITESFDEIIDKIFSSNSTLKKIKLQSYWFNNYNLKTLLKLPPNIKFACIDCEMYLLDFNSLKALCNHIHVNQIDLIIKIQIKNDDIQSLNDLVEMYINCHKVIQLLSNCENSDPITWQIQKLYKMHKMRNESLYKKLIY